MSPQFWPVRPREMQSGTGVVSAGAGVFIAFPRPFSAAPQVVATASVVTGRTFAITGTTTTGFTIWVDSTANVSFRWIAVL